MQGDGVAALLARLQADVPRIVWTREPKYQGAAGLELPLGIVVASRADRLTEPDAPPAWRQVAAVLVYLPRTADQDRDMLALVDELEAALAPHDGEYPEGDATTLGGAVVAAWLAHYTLGHSPEPTASSVAVMLEVHLQF